MADLEKRKLRPLFVAQYLAQNADDSYPVTTTDILDHLEQEHGITSDRKSIYRDIVLLRDHFGMDIKTATDSKGYYLMSRQFELDDLILITECINAAKFVSEKRSEEMLDVLCEFCSKHQARYLKPRRACTIIKTEQDSTLRTISIIRQAIQNCRYHNHPLISFQYLTHSLDNPHLLIEKHGGKTYTVSPVQLMINDGNYYMLACDRDGKNLHTFRIDRMAHVTETFEYGRRCYISQMESYLQRTFSMYDGEVTKATIQFDNSLFDTVIDKFGPSVPYVRNDGEHFTVTTDIAVSPQFFGWLCGFGTKAKLMGPDDVVDQFRAYIDKIREMY